MQYFCSNTRSKTKIRFSNNKLANFNITLNISAQENKSHQSVMCRLFFRISYIEGATNIEYSKWLYTRTTEIF